MCNIPKVRLKVIKEDGVRYDVRPVMSNPESSAGLFRAFAEYEDREQMMIAFLNAKNRVVGVETVSVGTVNASLIHPREVFKSAILLSASAIMMCHNHPSGDVKPSKEDREMTERIKKAGEVLGIALMDHIIIGADKVDGYYSFAQQEF